LHLTKDRHPRRRKSAVALGTAILTAGVGLATVLGSITAQAGPVVRNKGHQLVARNQDGRLEEFYLDSGGSIKHRWQTSPGGSWHAIATVGAPVSPYAFASDPAVGLGGDGRLAVFVVDSNNNVEEAAQSSPGAGFTAFVSLSGGYVQGTVAVGVNADGRMEIFARAYGGNAILHAWQNTPGGSFGTFASLGGPTDGNWFNTDPSVAINADGRLEVFAGANGRVQHAWQKTPGAGWAAFHALLGVNVYSNVVAVTANADGRLEIFVRAPSSSGPAIWHAWQLTPGGGWHAWKSLGVALNGFFPLDPVVGRNADGRLEVFTVDNNFKVEHAYQTVPGDGWNTFTSLDGAVQGATTVVSNTDGRLELFDQGTSNVIQHSWQMMPNASWSAWFSLGGTAQIY
jgi:hypothetical protein